MLAGSSSLSAENKNNPRPWTLEYASGMQSATINENGKITLTRHSPGDFYKGATGTINGMLDKSATKVLFDLAAKDAFQQSEKEYRPPKGSFEYHGHSLITILRLRDAKSRIIHEVTYSDKPEHPVPDAVKELAEKTGTAIDKKFGPPPPFLID